MKIAYRQTKEGDVVSFRIHPDDRSAALSIIPLGTTMKLEISDDDFLNKD